MASGAASARRVRADRVRPPPRRSPDRSEVPDAGAPAGAASVGPACRAGPGRAQVPPGRRDLLLSAKGEWAMSFTKAHLYFDDVDVGQDWESGGRTVTEADIVNFAGLSGDFNPIHIDHEFAKTTVFRRPIAHGLLVLSIGSGVGLMFPPMRTLAIVEIKDWQFKGPIFSGDTIHVRSTVL